MKITLSPDLSAIKKNAEYTVGTFFHRQNNDVLVEHMQKRFDALAVQAGEEPSEGFAEAAEIEGMSSQELAQTILAKPNDILAKGNARRKIIVAIRNATSVAEIDELLKPYTEKSWL